MPHPDRMDEGFFRFLDLMLIPILAVGVAILFSLGGCTKSPPENVLQTPVEMEAANALPETQPVRKIIPIQTPRLTYVMQGVSSENGVINDKTLDKADGIVLRTRWRDIETVDGIFSFNYLRKEIARANRMGKKIYLQVLSSDDSPRWLQESGVEMRDGIPVPWNEKYLAHYARMIVALRDNLILDQVTHFASPGADNSEWHYKQFKKFYPVKDADMVRGHLQLVDILNRALPPHIIVVANLGDHDKAWTATAIAELKKRFKGRIGFEMCSLSGQSPATYAGIARIEQARKEGHHVAMELVQPSNHTNFKGTYAQAVTIANRTIGDAGILCPYQYDIGRPQK